MQAFESMAGPRPKKPAPSGEEEIVTPDFRREARAALGANDFANRRDGYKKGDIGYRLANQSDLAGALGCDKRAISFILGPVREDSPPLDLVEKSALVAPIRRLLKMRDVTTITIPTNRAPILRRLGELSDASFAHFERVFKDIDR